MKQSIAAVDLGSNSFHMIVAVDEDGRLQIVDRMKEMVRLAAGLDEENRLDESARERACACLDRFGERLREFPPAHVRAVGTNTLREASNAGQFLSEAQTALGHRIDIVSGYEEARLIYLGVSHSLEDNNERRLVIDIGGGSTELILGQRFKPSELESLHMGCVGMSARFFGDGTIDSERMDRAVIAAGQELEAIGHSYRTRGWETGIGASGTILAIRDILASENWADEGITRSGLQSLAKSMCKSGHVDKLKLAGLQPERQPVFPGGVAILIAIFNEFGLEHLRVANGALREGLLYDLLGRVHQKDIRDRTVSELARRYHLDRGQSERVNELAQSLFADIRDDWALDHEHGRFLRWAAMLHEVGLSISHSQYHKHSAYLLENLDMPGFSRGEQRQLAGLVRWHRRKIRPQMFEAFTADATQNLTRLCILLRLATLLTRTRGEAKLPPVTLEWHKDRLRLRFPEQWLEAHPLTSADLEQEVAYLKTLGVKLKYK